MLPPEPNQPQRVFAPHSVDGSAVADAGIYVHIPFCSVICPYCDFAVARGDSVARADFAAALISEIASWRAPGIGFDTVYFGGGTPSLLEPSALTAICDQLITCFDLAPDCHWSLEANPEDVTVEGLVAWRELGFGSLSLGVQSLDDRALRFLGRRHRAGEAQSSLRLALEAGFETVSADLIYGLPGQTQEDWARQLDQITELGPQHLSCYELTVHEGTPFERLRAKGRLRLPGQDLRGTLFEQTHRSLEKLGWAGYEVSSFARHEHFRSRHNQKYWRHVPYLGFGPSAHSFDGSSRWWNARQWQDYARRLAAGIDPVEDRERLETRDLALETVLLAMRTTAGLDLDAFSRRFEIDLRSHREGEIGRCIDRGWLWVDDRRSSLRPTLQGLAVADELARLLTP